MTTPKSAWKWPRTQNQRRTRTWTPVTRFLAAFRFRHGTISAYLDGCPCDACREVNRLAQRRQRA